MEMVVLEIDLNQIPADKIKNFLRKNGNESNLSLVDCFRNYRNYKWIPFPQRYISKHKEHYQEIIDNTKVRNDTIFLCDRVDLFKIK